MGITYEVTMSSDGEYGLSDPDPDKFTGMLRSVSYPSFPHHELISALIKIINVLEEVRQVGSAVRSSTVTKLT